MMTIDATTIAKLTERQRHVLGCICINQDGGHHPRTLKALLDKELIVSFQECLPGWPPMQVTRYTFASLEVHISYCEWAAWTATDDELPELAEALS